MKIFAMRYALMLSFSAVITRYDISISAGADACHRLITAFLSKLKCRTLFRLSTFSGLSLYCRPKILYGDLRRVMIANIFINSHITSPISRSRAPASRLHTTLYSGASATTLRQARRDATRDSWLSMLCPILLYYSFSLTLSLIYKYFYREPHALFVVYRAFTELSYFISAAQFSLH